jgi:GNAT superfamily N-acetyltransferase
VKALRVAKPTDLGQVLDLLNAASHWIKSQGGDQWGAGFGADRIGPMVARGEVFLVYEDDVPIATCAASPNGDTDFWTPEELAEPALYISKIAIARDQAGSGLGAMLFRWFGDRAYRRGAHWVRVDVWRTNADLRDYYLRTGWTYLRTVERAHRRSGALFQRPAAIDLRACSELLSSALPALNPDFDYQVGDRVMVDIEGSLEPGTIATRWGTTWGDNPRDDVRPVSSYLIETDGGRRCDRSHHQVRRLTPPGDVHNQCPGYSR